VGHTDDVLAEQQVIGAGSRYAKCLRCGSTDRDRLVYLYLRDHTDYLRRTDIRVLHIAPERCIRKKLEGRLGKNYIAADKFTRGYFYGRRTQRADITALSFPDVSFTLIICNHVLEHIPDERKALAELYRVLAPGGTAILQVPVSAINERTIEDSSIATPEARRRVYGQFDHVRLYGQDYPDRLADAGFHVHIQDIAGQYPDAALDKRERLFTASRP